MKGRCVCGKVTLELAHAPEYINICNCGLCRPTGAAWGYFRPEDLTVTGETRPFQRDDLDEVWLTVHFCPGCGAATHYTSTGRAPLDRIGVNTRLFVQDELDGVPVVFQDGRAVITGDDEYITTGTGHIGDGKAF